MSRGGLPMYDLPGVERATDAWWEALVAAMAAEGIADLPPRHERPERADMLWSVPDMLLSQTCGWPLVREWAGVLTPLLTPCYAAEGVDGPHYASFITVREDHPAQCLEDLRGAAALVNEWISHSGMNALRHTVAPLAVDGRFFGSVRASGGHVYSAGMIQRGEADVAAIDCISFALLSRHNPDAVAGLRRLGRTAHAPGLPYVTLASASDDLVARLRAALDRAFVDPNLAGLRDDLLIAGHADLAIADYARIDEMEAEAQAHGYPTVA